MPTTTDCEQPGTIPARTLSKAHRAELYASGLSDETIDAAGLYTCDAREICEILRWRPKDFVWGDALVFPYPGCDGYARLKPTNPRHSGDRVVKYESPRKGGNRVYYPPTFDTNAKFFVITEGEKKTLAVSQCGLNCIGLSGVWSWQVKRPRNDFGKAFGPRKLIGDLDALKWDGCEVVLCCDSDVEDNLLVAQAEHGLAAALQARGAYVRVARLPGGDDGKTGADDFIVAHGAEAFKRIIDSASEPEELENPSPMDWAKRFLAEHFDGPGGLELRWWRETFYRYDGRRYVPTDAKELAAIILEWLDRCRKGVKPRDAADVLRGCEAVCRVQFGRDWPMHLGDNPPSVATLLALHNGIIDLDEAVTGDAKLRPHSPLYFSPFALPYSYNPDATCPTWFATLDQLFDGDESCIDLLGEWFGYCITGDTSLQAIMILEGPPRSGKGTVMRCLQHVIGRENCAAPRLNTLAETFGLWGLVGKRVALCSDAMLGRGDRALGVLETLKLISGEDAVEVHRKNLPSITTRLRVRFMLGVNQLPKFGDNANALAARALILPFRNSFVGKEDRTLEQRIESEAPAILHWAIEGLARLRSVGRFTQPAASEGIKADFARLTSPVRGFVEDECAVAPAETVAADDLWARWTGWCEGSGHLAGSKDTLGSALRVVVPGIDKTRRRNTEGQRGYCYTGLGLLER